MPSQLEDAIARFRADLLKRDAATLGAIASAYQETRATLLKRIELLATALEAEDAPTGSEIMRWDRARALLKQTEAELAALGVKVRPDVFAAKAEAVDFGTAYAQSITAEVATNPSIVATVETSWNRLNTPAAEAIVGRMADGAPLNSWFGQFGAEAGDRMAQALRTAAALGTNPRGVARMLEKEVDASGFRLLNMARTEVLGAYRDATLQNYLANADILDGWEWLSAKQTRTCLACLALDGQLFELTTTFQPSHNSCRCSSIPRVKGEPPRQRQTASEWFAQQPEAVKRKMIPATAYDDFAAGKLTLQDFVYLDKDEVWGDRYRQGSVAYARDAAKRRRAGASTTIPTVQSAPKGAPKPPPSGGTPPPTPSSVAAQPAPTERRRAITERAAQEQKPPQSVALEQAESTVEIPAVDTLPPMPDELTYEQVFGQAPVDSTGTEPITDLASPITDDEDFSLIDYRSGGFGVNTALREGRRLYDTELVAAIDDVLARSTLPTEQVVYRGMSGNPFGNLVKSVGKPFTDAGYVSTSFKRSVAEQFAGEAENGVVLRIRVPAGANALDMRHVTTTSKEGEMLLPRGSTFRVLAVDMQATPPIVDMELIR